TSEGRVDRAGTRPRACRSFQATISHPRRTALDEGVPSIAAAHSSMGDGSAWDEGSSNRARARSTSSRCRCSPAAHANRSSPSPTNRILSFAAEMGWRSPAHVPLAKVAITEAEWLTVDELRAVLDHAGKWRLAIMLGARAGLRRGGIVELRWRDVDLENQRIYPRRRASDFARGAAASPARSQSPSGRSHASLGPA